MGVIVIQWLSSATSLLVYLLAVSWGCQSTVGWKTLICFFESFKPPFCERKPSRRTDCGQRCSQPCAGPLLVRYQKYRLLSERQYSREVRLTVTVHLPKRTETSLITESDQSRANHQLLQLCTVRTAWSDSDQAVRAVHSCKSWFYIKSDPEWAQWARPYFNGLTKGIQVFTMRFLY